MPRMYPFTAVPGSQYGMPPQLLGPTGMIFVHPNGYSTHLNTIVSDVPGREGKQSIIPLLVPNQVNIDTLLAGRDPSPTQIRIAEKYVGANPTHIIGTFDTVPEAAAYEKEWHQKMWDAGSQYLPKDVVTKGKQ